MNCLDGIRVIDMTQFLSASYCAQILGDLGADVIKIEPPDKGEVYRTYGPKFINGESTSFLSVNRNKKSLALDLRSEKAQEVMKRLIENSDVLVENFKPGKLKKYGIDYDSSIKINPKLIYCSVSGFGQTGPYADKGGFDLVAQGMSGLMSVTGEKEGPPVKVGYPVTDIGSGMYAAIGVLAALVSRYNTGRGQWVDTSLFETGVAWGLMTACNYFADGSIQKRMGSASPQNAPYDAYRAMDGAFTVGTGNEQLWERFCKVFDIEYLVSDSRYANNALRVANQQSLTEDIEGAVKDLTVDECIRRLDGAGIPCGPINSIDKVLKDPHVIERGMILEMEHKKAGKIKNLGFPVKLSDTPANVRLAPPLLSEHTGDILTELGFSEYEVLNMEKSGVVRRG